MRCELETGAVREVRTEDELEAALNEMGREGHLILSGEYGFVQIARSGSGAIVQCSDGGVMYEADRPVSLGEAREMLGAFLTGDESWRDHVEWSEMDVQPGEVPSDDEDAREQPERDQDDEGGRFGGGAGRKEKGLGESVADEAVRAVKRKARRAIRQGIRRFMR